MKQASGHRQARRERSLRAAIHGSMIARAFVRIKQRQQAAVHGDGAARALPPSHSSYVALLANLRFSNRKVQHELVVPTIELDGGP